jgi:hypothetical protein
MHSGEAEVEPQKHISGKWHRLIPSRFPPVDVYQRLGSMELAAVAKEIEDKTNPRLKAKSWMVGKAGVTEASPRVQNWNHAPFAYRNPEGSTWLNPGYGALEMVDGERAALAWALRRREIFLARTQEPPMGLDMRMLVTPINGAFDDLRDRPASMTEKERWAVGDALYKQGSKGVIFTPTEHPRVRAITVFNAEVLGSSAQAAHYRFLWDGVAISTIYDFSDGTEVTRDELLVESGARAAA